jgi:hypothetical protein
VHGKSSYFSRELDFLTFWAYPARGQVSNFSSDLLIRSYLILEIGPDSIILGKRPTDFQSEGIFGVVGIIIIGKKGEN